MSEPGTYAAKQEQYAAWRDRLRKQDDVIDLDVEWPAAELTDKTLEFARRIADRPTVAALLVKDSVNAATDAMGFSEAMRHSFHIHELGHAHWAALNENGFPVALPPEVEDWRTARPTEVARRDTP